MDINTESLHMKKLIAILLSSCWLLITSAQVNITRSEYFIDTDPGFGNGTSISIIPSPDISNINLAVPLGSLSPGRHALFIRSRDAGGRWGVSSRTFFDKTGYASLPPNITRVEYFIDTDPGFGNGITIPITSSPDISNINLVVPLNTTPAGLHALCIRSKDANGIWGITSKSLFYKTGYLNTPPNITSC